MASPRRLVQCVIAAAVGAGGLLGCKGVQLPAEKKTSSNYVDLGLKQVPPYMRGTIYERVELSGTTFSEVSGYGLVVNLDHTGNNDTLPAAVKSYMTKEMVKEGFGNRLTPGYEKITPERVLRDDRVAVVEVHGYLPPGIRKNQTFDVAINVLARNDTSSLAGGELYRTDLKLNGVNPTNPFGPVNVWGKAKGFVFVNPAYALQRSKTPTTGPARAALRNGLIMDGGMAVADRPLMLQLRQPQSSVSRAIEQRIRARFGDDDSVARAKDEGIVEIYVPTERYGSDWKHFAAVCLHSYFNSSPEFAVARTKQLVEEAQKPDAPLGDISYCWEALGTPAMPFISQLLSNRSPEVAYAAARAMAFVGDDSGAALATLMTMARTANHPFQLSAVQTLGAVPNSIAINHMLRELLDCPQTLVRIEAYRILARSHDGSVFSRVITEDPANQKFILDVVPSTAAPLIYATRTGTPRIAVIGGSPQIERGVQYLALNNRFMIQSDADQSLVKIFYRDAELPHSITTPSRSDVSEVIGRLGGLAAPDQTPFNFSYGEIVAMLQDLSDQHKLTVERDGQQALASFMLQEPARVVQDVTDAAPIADGGRPQTPAQSPELTQRPQ